MDRTTALRQEQREEEHYVVFGGQEADVSLVSSLAAPGEISFPETNKSEQRRQSITDGPSAG